jgi:hypothetical protein
MRVDTAAFFSGVYANARASIGEVTLNRDMDEMAKGIFLQMERKEGGIRFVPRATT